MLRVPHFLIEREGCNNARTVDAAVDGPAGLSGLQRERYGSARVHA